MKTGKDIIKEVELAIKNSSLDKIAKENPMHLQVYMEYCQTNITIHSLHMMMCSLELAHLVSKYKANEK